MEDNNELLEYHCTNCGTRIGRDDTRCPSCGAELEGFIDEESEGDTFTIEDETEIEKTVTNEYHCPHCGIRLSLEDTRCPSCGAELESFKDDIETTIELKQFTNDVDAELAKTLLQAEGIECYLTGGNSDGTLFTPYPIRLVVLKRDMKRALEILEY